MHSGSPTVCLAITPAFWVTILEAVHEQSTLEENHVCPTRGSKKINKEVNPLFQRHHARCWKRFLKNKTRNAFVLVPTVVTKYASEVNRQRKDLPCLPQSFSLLWQGGMVHLPLHRPRKEEGEGEKPVVTCFSVSPFYSTWTPGLWDGVAHSQGRSLGKPPSQTHPEVGTASLLGVSPRSHAASCLP